MQLTSILLYEHLKEQFHIEESHLLSKEELLARPFFYEAGREFQAHHVYVADTILDVKVLKSAPEDVFFILRRQDKPLSLENISCIVLAEETSVIGVFNFLQGIFDFYENWENQLTAVCVQEGSLLDLLELSREVFQNPLCLTGTDFSLAAQAGLSQLPEEYRVYQDAALLVERINAVSQDKAFRLADNEKEPVLFPAYLTGHRSLNRNLFFKRRVEYRISVIENRHAITEKDSYLLDVLAQHLEYMIHKIHSEHSSRSTTLNSIFQSVLSDKTADYMEISRLLSNVGWLPEHFYLCSVIKNTDLSQSLMNAKTICKYIKNAFPFSCSIIYEEYVVSFYNLTLLEAEAEDVFSELVYFIRDSMLTAGYSRTISGHMHLRRLYLQALTALRLGGELQPERWIHHFNQIALPYIMKQITRTFPGNMLCYEKLLELKRMDEVQKTEYVKTLRVYLAHNLNAVQSARALYIHRSTFLYRLEKIKNILETDFEDAEEVFYLNLSLRILEKK